jgi:ubiquinone/menaquinone biosynthesis C-methylase UbiE
MYFRTLDKLTFGKWLDKNYEKINKPILELGCGTGKQSIQIAQKYKEAVCLDISEEMISRVKYKIDHLDIPNKLNFIVADAEDPPVKNNMFGACIMCSTLHHVSSPENAIRNLSDKLAAGGLFFSSDPNDSYVRFIFDFLMKIWKLHDEKASDDPLIKEKSLRKWLSDAKIQNTVKFSTYLPPHIFLFLTEKPSLALLSRTDNFFNRIPGFHKFSGLIISEGIKIET